MRWFKRIAIGAGILLVLAAAGLAALVWLVDPNHYKGPVAEAVKKQYGRTLRIDGDVQLSVFPDLGLEAEKLSLSEPRSAQIFAAVDTVRASVAVLPLLSGRIVVDRVKVAGLKANVVRYQNGKFNFDDLLGPRAGAPAASPPAPPQGKPLLFDVAGIEFTGGELALRDYVKGTSMRVERLSATTGRVTPRVPFDMEVSARVLGQSPRVDATVQARGRLQFDPQARTFSAQGFDLKAAGVLPSVRATALTARGDLAFDGTRHALDATGVSAVFQGDIAGRRPLTGVDLRIDVPRLAAGLDEGRLQVQKLSVAAQGRIGPDPFELSVTAPDLRVSPREAQGEALNGRLRVAGAVDLDARLTLAGIAGNGDKLEIARFALDGEFKQGARMVKLASASPFEASIRRKKVALPQWTGQVDIEDPALPGGSMRIPFKGMARANFDKEHAAAKLEAAIEGGDLTASADVAQFDEPRITFSLAADVLDLDKLAPARRSAARTAAAPAGKAAAPADPPVDLSVLEGITASGGIKIGRLVARGLKADNLAATVRVAKGRADVTGLKAGLYGGTLTGSLFADAGSGRIGMSPTLTNVSVRDLLADVAHNDSLAGRGTIALNLTATGKTVQGLKRGLNGTASLSIRDGAIKGVNLAQSLREFRAMLALRKDDVQQHQQARQTDFSELSAQLVFAGGIGTVRNLNMKAPLLRIAEGDPARIDLPAGRYDLVARVTVVNTSTGQGGKELAELRNITVPVHVTGPLDAPDYSIQWSQVAADALRNVLKGTLEEGLGIGPDTGDKLRDTVRDRLKGLFNR